MNFLVSLVLFILWRIGSLKYAIIDSTISDVVLSFRILNMIIKLILIILFILYFKSNRLIKTRMNNASRSTSKQISMVEQDQSADQYNSSILNNCYASTDRISDLNSIKISQRFTSPDKRHLSIDRVSF